MTQPDIDSLVPWQAWRRLETGKGIPMMLRCTDAKKWQPDETFWQAWRHNKDFLKAEGVALGKEWVKPGAPPSDRWEVKQWRQLPPDVLAQINGSIKASQAVDTDVAVPCPEGLEYFGFQKAGIAFCRGREGVLLADEMGLGKSPQSIGVINDDPTINRVLVVCPASLKVNWYRELQRWLMRPLKVWIADSKFFPATDIVIVNYDILGNFEAQLARGFDLVIADEIHFCKDSKSLRAKRLFKIPARRRLGLSGTPIVNRPLELYPIVHWLAPLEFSNWFQFMNRYTGSADKLKALHVKLRSNLMIRRLKKDVMKDLPAKLHVVVEIDAPEIRALVRQEQEFDEDKQTTLERLQAALELAKASDDEQDYRKAVDALTAACRVAFEEMAAVRSALGAAKLPYVIEHLTSLVEQGVKVVHFAHHRNVIEAVHRAFPGKSVIHYGGMDQSDKQASVDRFQRDPECLVFSGSLKASGVGITLTASSWVVFGEQDWVPGVMSQAGDRCHRIGQVNSVTIQHLVAKDSLDSNMAKATVDKSRTIDQALDSDRESLAMEPVAPLVRSAGHVSVARKEIAEKALTISKEHIQVVHRCLGILAAVCDGARERDGLGFNGVDAAIGRSLAEQNFLTAKQCVLGIRILKKYKKQLPEDMYGLLP